MLAGPREFRLAALGHKYKGTWKVHLSFYPNHKSISGTMKHKKVIVAGNDEG